MSSRAQTAAAVFNVRDFGAGGSQAESAQAAIQRAVDACAAAGGGVVYFPPGAYTTGTIHLRSFVRLLVEAGATIYSSKDPASFDEKRRALFVGEGVEHIGLEGRGTIEGQAEYVSRASDYLDWNIHSNQVLAQQAGVPLIRSFPTENTVGHLVLLLHCRDVRIESLSFLHSPSWTMHMYDCERVNIDGVYIYTSRRDGVWADGIDPDGCRDVRIANCTIDTGDDAIVFYSYNIFGPPLPCENITVTNCRLSSSSSAIKFCDCNMNVIRNVTIDNCVITASNRGIAFMVFDGGLLENVVLSNLTIECVRHDWFWWGDGDPIHFNLIQRSDLYEDMDKSQSPPIGAMRNIHLSNIIAHGPGPCRMHGRADAPLENISFENIRLTVDADPASPWKKGPHALTIENARNLRLTNVEIGWQAPSLDHWQSALAVENVQGLVLDGLSAGSGPDAPEAPAVSLKDCQDVSVQNSRALPGTGAFLQVSGAATRAVVLWGNDLRLARVPLRVSDDVAPQSVQAG